MDYITPDLRPLARDIELFLEDPANARKHSDKNVETIKGSLASFKQRTPIVAQKTAGGLIVRKGNATLQVAKALGWKKIAAVIVDEDNTSATAYAIADNRAAELGEWNKEVLGAQLQSLREDGFELEELGFEIDDLEHLDLNDGASAGGGVDEDREDDVPEVKKSFVKRGEIWVLGDHRLMCGDSTKREDVERLMAVSRASLCFTSPPYADQREYNGGKELSTEYLARFLPAAKDFVTLFAVNLGLSRKNGEINQYWDDYIRVARDSGLLLLSWNVWDRSGGGFTVAQATAMFAIEHEFIFVFGEQKRELNRTIANKCAGEKAGWIRQADGTVTYREKTINQFRQLGTVIKCMTSTGQATTLHPATFPVAFPEQYINACTSNGDGVYEPFCGSGSTLIACEKTGRRCFGMEIDPHYASVIVERWQDLTGKKAVKLGS